MRNIAKKVARIRQNQEKKCQKHAQKKNTKNKQKLRVFNSFFVILMEIWGASAQGALHRTSKTRQKSAENDL